MSRNVTALYDTRAEAEAARQRLSSEVSLDRIKIIDKDGGGSSGGGSGSGGGLGGLYLSNEDRHAYGEGIRRGGFLLCADVESGEDADKIVRLLEESSSVDMDERQSSWQSEGWSPQAATGGMSSGNAGSISGSGASMQSSAGTTSHASGNVVAEEHIPIVEEELRIGKREVERGGARVRSYVREVPVQEQVTLREEHVSVERRPVAQGQSQTLSQGQTQGQFGGQALTQGQSGVTSGHAEDLLQERTIEMRETAEEAVVQKVANVREEVVVTKTAEEHVEQVNETVRHTEVDVQEGGTGDRSAFGGFGSGQSQGSGQASTGSSQSDFERDKTR
jgi:stress response protein YsnF